MTGFDDLSIKMKEPVILDFQMLFDAKMCIRDRLNTLFVTSEDIYLSLDGENVVANRDKQVVARYPLHTLQGIISFSYAGASPALMGACCQRRCV